MRWYFVLMGTCIGLIVLAWNVVRLWSTTAAVLMSVAAAALPPVAAIVANPPWQRRSGVPPGAHGSDRDGEDGRREQA